MNNLAKLIIITAFVYSCSNQNIEKEPSLFDPTIHLSVDNIVLNGYEKVVGIDVPAYELINKDTIRSITFDFDQKAVRSKTWSVKFDHFEKEKSEDFLRKQGFTLSQNLCYNLDSFCHFRYLYNSRFNEVYRVITDTIKNSISITCFYPSQEDKEVSEEEVLRILDYSE